LRESPDVGPTGRNAAPQHCLSLSSKFKNAPICLIHGNCAGTELLKSSPESAGWPRGSRDEAARRYETGGFTSATENLAIMQWHFGEN